jgi:hypothetical protein
MTGRCVAAGQLTAVIQRIVVVIVAAPPSADQTNGLCPCASVQCGSDRRSRRSESPPAPPAQRGVPRRGCPAPSAPRRRRFRSSVTAPRAPAGRGHISSPPTPRIRLERNAANMHEILPGVLHWTRAGRPTRSAATRARIDRDAVALSLWGGGLSPAALGFAGCSTGRLE